MRGEEEKEEGERESACSAIHAIHGATVQCRAARLCNMVRCRTVRQRGMNQ